MKKIIKNYLFGLKNNLLPSYLTFYVNNVCQLRCDMCFYWDSMQKKTVQLNLEQIIKIAKSLPNLLQLSLTGGEPSLRKDLPAVVKIFCQYSNVAKCSIITNGFLTERIVNMTKEILSENKETSFRLCISIDGLEETHDRIRGVKNSFRNAISTFFELKKLKEKFNNLHVDINTTISKFNYKNFFDLTKFVDHILGPDHHTVTITRGITKEKDADQIPLEDINNILLHIKNRKNKNSKLEHKLIKILRRTMYDEIKRLINENSFKYYCTSGKKYIVIYQDGNTASCEILHTIHPNQSSTLGNLAEFDFDCQKLLAHNKAKEKIKWIKDNKCFCTFECAKSNDVVFNPKLLLKTLINTIVK